MALIIGAFNGLDEDARRAAASTAGGAAAAGTSLITPVITAAPSVIARRLPVSGDGVRVVIVAPAPALRLRLECNVLCISARACASAWTVGESASPASSTVTRVWLLRRVSSSASVKLPGRRGRVAVAVLVVASSPPASQTLPPALPRREKMRRVEEGVATLSASPAALLPPLLAWTGRATERGVRLRPEARSIGKKALPAPPSPSPAALWKPALLQRLLLPPSLLLVLCGCSSGERVGLPAEELKEEAEAAES